MASARDYAEWIVKNQDKKGTPEFDTVAQAYKAARTQEQVPAAPTPTAPQGEATPDPASQLGEDIAGSRPVRFAMGAAAPFAGALQLGANIGDKIAAEFGLQPSVGKAINEHLSELENVKQRGMKAAGNEGYDVMGLLGNILSPAALSANKAMTATSLAGKVGQGAALGAGYGATTPVTGAEGTDEFLKAKALQTAGGAAVGAAVPLALEPLKKLGTYLYHIVEPYMPGGTERIMKRVLEEAAGPRKPAIQAELAKPQAIVPGSEPVAGEAATAAGSAEFSAVQKQLMALRPSEYAARASQQEAARRAAIQSVGGTPADLQAAEAAREAAAAKAYPAAFAQRVRGDPELARLARNPYFQDALPDAAKLSEAQGINAKDNLTQFLHNVKLSLDKSLGRTGDTALAESEKRATQNVKSAIVKWLETKNPAYEAARAQYAAQSVPINQMSVGQYLEKKLIAPLGTTERASVFANAAGPEAVASVRRATSFKNPRELADVLTPTQVQSVEGVTKDLARQSEFNQLATAGSQRGREILGDIEKRPGYVPTLHRAFMIGQAIMRRLEGHASRKVLEGLSEKMQDPQEIARLLRDAPPGVRQQLLQEAGQLAKTQGAIGAPSIMFAKEQ